MSLFCMHAYFLENQILQWKGWIFIHFWTKNNYFNPCRLFMLQIGLSHNVSQNYRMKTKLDSLKSWDQQLFNESSFVFRRYFLGKLWSNIICIFFRMKMKIIENMYACNMVTFKKTVTLTKTMTLNKNMTLKLKF